MKMICNHAETCSLKRCPHIEQHELKVRACKPTECTEADMPKCIPYVDPAFKRIQERFDIELGHSERNLGYYTISRILARILHEVSEE